MKLLFIIHGIEGGGAEKQMQNLLRHFASLNHEVHLAICRKPEKTALPQNITIHYLGADKKPASFYIFWGTLKLLQSLKPDRIQLFQKTVGCLWTNVNQNDMHPLRDQSSFGVSMKNHPNVLLMALCANSTFTNH